MHANDLSQPRPGPWLRAATLDWLAITAAAAALALHLDELWAYLLAALVVGNRQHALAILGHDGGHRLVCRRKWLNDALTNLLCFWPLGAGIHSYRRFHFAHHRSTGTALDPELELKRRATPRYDLPTSRLRMVCHFAQDLLGGGIREIIDLVEHMRPMTWGDRFGPLLWWLTVGSVCIALGALPIVLLWFGSLLTVYWAMFRLRIWTEHMGTTETHRIEANWWQRLLYAPHNTWYHFEHHRWPNVPFSCLPAARELDSATPVIGVHELFAEYARMAATGSGQPTPAVQRATPEPRPQSFLRISEHARAGAGRS